MLTTRILTALLIALLTFMVIFLTSQRGFQLLLTILWLTGSWEFARLAGLGRASRWILFGTQVILIGLMVLYWQEISSHALTFLATAGLTWCVMFLRLLTFRPGLQPGINYHLVSFFCAVAGISFAWYALAWLRAQTQGEFLILLLMFIIWAADTGAYFAGRWFGKHKLAPSISPGKTREGLLGGVIVAVLIALLVSRLTLITPPGLARLVMLTIITVLAAAAGDLFISLHKRTMGLKDSGRIFPGHGGVLDRYDSLLTGAPFFALVILILGS